MSLSLFARKPLLRGQATFTLRAARVGLSYPATNCANPAVVARTFHTQPGSSEAASARRSWPLKRLGSGLVAAGGGWFYLGSNDTRTFSIHSPLESDGGDIKQLSGSSTLLRPASPAAPRKQTVALVFLTSSSTGKGLAKNLMSNFGGGSGETEKWLPWIGYFREAGYDCLQMNLALPHSNASSAETSSNTGVNLTTSRLADELHSQIRLSNLQRQPVLFVHHSSDSSLDSTSQIISSYIKPSQSEGGGGGIWSKIFGGGGMFGTRPAISGLVVISDLDDASALTLFGTHPKLNTLIVANGGASKAANQGKIKVLDAAGESHEKVIRDIERWLIKEGYEA